MFAFVVLIFMVCWAPYHIYFIYSYHHPSIARKAYIGHIFLFFYWLAMSNTCVNPIIYYVMNVRFRAYFNQVLCCIPSYLKRSTTKKWRRCSSSASKLSFISRSQSYSESLKLNRHNVGMPPRALGMSHSHTLDHLPGPTTVDCSTNTTDLEQENRAIQTRESSFTFRSREVLL